MSAFVLSHRRASLSLRERFAYSPAEATEAAARMVRHGIATEAVIVSTCHRLEVYAVLANSANPNRLGQLLCDDREMSWAAVRPFACSLFGLEVAEHLFTVTAGLDSMLAGETEILGQVRAAYGAAKEAGTVGTQLDGLMRWAIHVGRRVRNETALGTVHQSLGARAVDVAASRLGGLRGRTVVILGAGRVARAVAEHARTDQATVVVCSRTAARARHLAGQGGQVLPLNQLGHGLTAADALVCCAASRNRLLTRNQLTEVVKARGAWPLVIIDLSVPRVVEVEAGHVPGVEVIDLDSLGAQDAGDDQALRNAIRDGRMIVTKEARAFGGWAAGREAGEVIAALRRRAEEICALELERQLRRHRSLSRGEAREVLRRALAKLLHAPTVATREAVASGDYALLSSVGRIFGVEDNAESFRP